VTALAVAGARRIPLFIAGVTRVQDAPHGADNDGSRRATSSVLNGGEAASRSVVGAHLDGAASAAAAAARRASASQFERG